MTVTAETDSPAVQGKAFFQQVEGLPSGSELPLSEVTGKLVFNERGLIPAITQDVQTGEVLMFAWMNRAALERTLSTGQVTYFSRSRDELWIKGETSGHYQSLVDMRIDCDGDVLLCLVRQEGAACHTGRRSCFYLAVDREQALVRVVDSTSR